MQGIVSLLDEEHQHKVERIWAELSSSFGVRGVYITPFPHFSYHVAKQYDEQKLAAILALFAANTAPFSIRTSGLGIFTATNPILFIPIVRNLELSLLHTAICPEAESVAQGAVEYYNPAQWMPHITIGQSDITGDNLPAIVAWLNQQPLGWEIKISSIGTIYAKGSKQYLGPQYELTGQQ